MTVATVLANIQHYLLLALTVAAFYGGIVSVIHAITVRADAFTAVDKQSKIIWIALLSIGIVFIPIFGVLSLPGLVGTVAMLVYVTDVRPRVDGVLGRSWFRKAT